MAECFVNNADQDRCRCGLFVSKDRLRDGRIRWQCPRCGPCLSFERAKNRQSGSV